MDRLEQLGSALSQVTLYDIKSAYNQAKNMVLNVTEMEAKVREATNDDPWGASSTLMQEIAQGTFNFQQFNEIMPCIYSRFMDKEARQWREIYKSLQLLEYIIKHGSERVVDDARSHLSTIKMLRNFQYIDEKGKDQGINVRNRAKELSEMLSDVDRIRTERRKAKANRNKYTGVGNDSMGSFGGTGRYDGFGSDSGSGSTSRYGGGGGGYDRDYGGYGGGGSSSSGFRDETPNRRGFDEYNAGDDEVPVPRRSNSLAGGSTAAPTLRTNPTAANSGAQAVRGPTTAKEVDLLGFGDDDAFSAPVAAPAKAAEKALPAVAVVSNPLDDGDDDFADFQAAPTAPAAPVAPIAPVRASANVFDILSATSTPPATRPVQPVQGGFGASGFSAMSPTANRTSFSSPGPMQPQSPSVFGGSQVLSPTSTSARPAPAKAPSYASTGSASAKPASPAVGFDDLWSLSLGSSSKPANIAQAGGAKSMKDLEKDKAQASIWGGGGGSAKGFGSGAGTAAASGSNGLDDLLL